LRNFNNRVYTEKYIHDCHIKFMREFANQSIENIKRIQERCLEKYPRGINVIIIPDNEIGRTYTRTSTFDPGRVFMSYEQLIDRESFTNPFSEDVLQNAKEEIDTYDPQTSLIWLFVVNGQNVSSMMFYRTDIVSS
jgi:hypothetical protein